MIRRALEISLHADPLTYGDSGAVGGQQILIRELVKNIQQYGYGVDVLTAQANPLWPEKFSLGHLGQVIRLSQALRRDEEDRWQELVDGLAAETLAWMTDSGRTHHILHSHYWISGLVAERIHQATGLPWVHSPVKMAEWTVRAGDRVNEVRMAAEKRLLHEANAVVVSYLSEAELIHRDNPELTVYIVPPGVDPAQFFSRDAGPVLRALGVRRRPVAYMGRLEMARGLRQALDVLAERDLPEDFLLMVLGGTRRQIQQGVPVSEDLAALGERLGSHVTFIGGMPHRGVAPYLAASEVAIAPNQGPTLGMAVLESLASGIPVVGSRVPGVADWINHGEDGYVVDREAIGSMWDYVIDLWNEPSRARKMGKAGQDKVHRLHTVHDMAQQMVGCYQEVTGLGRHQMGVGF